MTDLTLTFSARGGISPLRLAWMLTGVSLWLILLQGVTPCAASGTVSTCGMGIALAACALTRCASHSHARRGAFLAALTMLLVNMIAVH